MYKKIVVGNTKYFFDTSTLTLFKDKVVKTALSENNLKKEDATLYKLVFNVSNTCNLRCKYCYASCGNYGRQNDFMSFDVIDKIVEQLKDKFKKIKTVYFFGGEPTLNKKIIEYAVGKLNENFDIQDYRIVTNATVVTDELIDLFDKNNFKVYVSIDGPKEINDYLRGPYYDKLISVIEKIKATKLKDKLELICTYTKYHQDKMSMEDLVKFYEDLGVKYSISDVITELKALKIKKTKKDLLDQEKKYIDMSFDRIFSNSLNVGISVYVRNVLEALTLQNSTDCFCKELNGDYSRVYDYNGDIYPCIRLIGTHKSGDLKVKSCNNKNHEQCEKCWAKNICRDCVADVVLDNVKAPYIARMCYKKQLYLYALNKAIAYYHNDSEKFNKLLSNYFKNYLF